jgi:hypothetical protein
MDEFGLSESAARCYAVALRTVEAPEKRQSMVAVPIGNRERVHFAVDGHSMMPAVGWADYFPGRMSKQAILGLSADAVLMSAQYGEAARTLESAHLEWEHNGLLQWIQPGSWGRLRV